ncbi:hypothetical protein acsn021_22860 [Anaerocolumna cellulosilytica]|uniref:Uncharacterized protein n=1 Tax=Anaerocolumna cellulosilytica TaxID=433286 RepID=A0A6S6R3U8_9FIRM|nr:hypothetical protein acsn021_22860 [Anaerocolumna cellulosilytica]
MTYDMTYIPVLLNNHRVKILLSLQVKNVMYIKNEKYQKSDIILTLFNINVSHVLSVIGNIYKRREN